MQLQQCILMGNFCVIIIIGQWDAAVAAHPYD